MPFDIAEWLNLALRWLHVIAGIAWIGASFYFVWLDNHLKPPKESKASGEVWSVHGGGFYHKQKYQVAPEQMPSDLHWFKWEAYFTWISGFSLLVLVYYWGANTYLLDPDKSEFTAPVAVAIALGSLVVGFLVYEALCRSPIGQRSEAFWSLWFAFLLAAAAFLDAHFNSKAAYIHIGAIVGSVMVGNVFFVIIPNQRKVVADLVAGATPDPKLGAQAKQRSVHNTYMTLPVLFIMISQHYPMTYGADRPWLVLGLLSLLGAAIRHLFILRHKGATSVPLLAITAALALASVSYVTWEQDQRKSAGAQLTASDGVSFEHITPILQEHCTSCHAQSPSNPAFEQAAVGLRLDTFEHAQKAAQLIDQRAVKTKSMPLGNMSGMTDEERAKLGAWINGGAKP